jgi:hypothetical protein
MKIVSSIQSWRIRGVAALFVPLTLALLPASAARADSDKDKFQVVPFVFDPAETDLAQSKWLDGIGCPTRARYAQATAANNFNPTKPTGTYTDPACPTGDQNDRENEGLLLAKTGPTDNNAAGGAELKGLPRNLKLTELGYDIRKPLDFADPRGSHCGAGAPRFNVTTTDNITHFIGCDSPPPVSQNVGTGWLRLRWNPATAFPPITPTETVASIEIIFDEGQDTGPDNFGLAVLDNIDVNGVLVGRGPDDGHDHGHGDDGDRHSK